MKINAGTTEYVYSICFCLILTLPDVLTKHCKTICTDWSVRTTDCCNSGLRWKTRSCDNDDSHHTCKERKEENCACNVDGQWSDWQSWSICSVTCGSGTRNRTRTCSNPVPIGTGQDCFGNSDEAQSCNRTLCPVDRQWSEWQSWSTCSVTCGSGTRNRTRTCSNPEPIGTGQDCFGNSDEVQSCTGTLCPVDGHWGEWAVWSSCSVTCGGGNQTSKRTCSNPEPSGGGNNCSGSTSKTQTCNSHICAVNGSWSEWRVWSSCSSRCGGGERKRQRQCTNPKPAGDGLGCLGPNQETDVCQDQTCTETTHTPTTDPSESAHAHSSIQGNEDTLPVGVIVSVPLLVVVAAVISTIVVCYCRMKRQKVQRTPDAQSKCTNGITNQAYTSCEYATVTIDNNSTSYSKESAYSEVDRATESDYTTTTIPSPTSSPKHCARGGSIRIPTSQWSDQDYSNIQYTGRAEVHITGVAGVLNGIDTDETYSRIGDDTKYNQHERPTVTGDNNYDHLQDVSNAGCDEHETLYDHTNTEQPRDPIGITDNDEYSHVIMGHQASANDKKLHANTGWNESSVNLQENVEYANVSKHTVDKVRENTTTDSSKSPVPNGKSRYIPSARLEERQNGIAETQLQTHDDVEEHEYFVLQKQ